MRTNTDALHQALRRGEYSHELLLACVAEGRRQRAEYISAGLHRFKASLARWMRQDHQPTPAEEPRVVARSSTWEQSHAPAHEAFERRAA